MSGRYRLQRRLGRGGMAEVFEAVATGERGFTRTVAVKRLLPEVGRVYDTMFLDEARIASHLHHANIVAVLDYGLVDDLPFQVLELVDGLDLQTALELHPSSLPIELGLHICTEVAHALSHAHSAAVDGRPLGIVHRDVKPANILVSYDGDVKLSDFGIAFARDRLGRTEVGVAKGTREYMSPEQWLAGEVDARSDVFALGCVLHALATGKSPMGQTRAGELLEGHELVLDETLPADVAAIVARATRRQKRDRYASAAEMAEALGQALTARLSQQPKTLMQQWMRAARPAAEARRDEPLSSPAVELLLDEKKGEKRFSTRVAVPRSRPWWLVGVAAVGLVSAVVWKWPSRVEVAPKSTTVAVPVTTPTPVTTPAPVTTPTPAPTPAVPIKTKLRPSREPPRPRPVPPEPAPPPAPVTPSPLSNGHLLVGGEGALRAEILVDGHPSGFAPKLLTLPVGSHDIELVQATGARLKRRLSIAETNTPSSPIRWLVP